MTRKDEVILEKEEIVRDDLRIADELRNMSGAKITLLKKCSVGLSVYPGGILAILGVKMYIMYPVYKKDPSEYMMNNAYFWAIALVIIYSCCTRSKLSRLFYIAAHGLLCLTNPVAGVWGFLGLLLLWGSKELWGINRMKNSQVDAEFAYRVQKYGYDKTDDNGMPFQ